MIKEILRKVTRSEPLLPRILTDYKPAVALFTPPYFDVVVADLILRARESIESGKDKQAREFFALAASEARGVFDKTEVKSVWEKRLRATYGIMLIDLYTDAGEKKKALDLINSLYADSLIPSEAMHIISSIQMYLDRH